MQKILNKKFNHYILVVLVFAFLFYNFNNFFVWLPNYQIFGHLIFNWPDSNANYFFSKLFSETYHFFQFEPLNLLTDNLLHTRSINVINSNLVPMTWLWPLLIFAFFTKIFGSLGILFFTPCLAAVSIFLFYRLVAHIFSSDILGFLSGILLAFFAPWFFFANEVMLPNVLFITFLLASLYIYLVRDKKYFYLASIFFLLAILMRPNEIIWLLVLLLLLIYYFHLYLNKQKIFIFLLIAFCLVSITLILNKLTYGSYLSFGYLNFQTSTLPTEFSQHNFSILKIWQFLIVPFSWHTKVFF